MMRTTRLQSLQMAAALLCALSAGQALAQAATTPAAKAETPASTGGGFLPPASANAKVIDSIQVVVNDEVITRNEVAGRVAQVSQNMKARNAQMPDPATMERQVLEAMIVERAQLQLAKEMGVKVDDRTLDATIGRIAENQKMSVQDMRNQMEKEGMPFAQFREDIRNEIMMQRLREHEVDSKIQISEAEVDTYMAASKAAAVRMETPNRIAMTLRCLVRNTSAKGNRFQASDPAGRSPRARTATRLPPAQPPPSKSPGPLRSGAALSRIERPAGFRRLAAHAASPRPAMPSRRVLVAVRPGPVVRTAAVRPSVEPE